MATTRQKIREQIQIEYGRFLDANGFNDNVDTRVIDLHVNQAINKFLNAQTKDAFKRGSIEVPASMLVEYTLTAASNAVTLPVFPQNLPLGSGVWRVYPSGDESAEYVPITKGFSGVIAGTNVDYLEGQIGYRQSGKTLRFTGTVTGDVVVEMLVSDFTDSVTGETDLLPITPEIESSVIEEVLRILSAGRFAQAELNSKDERTNAN